MGGDVCGLTDGASATTENGAAGPRESRVSLGDGRMLVGCSLEEANLLLVGLLTEMKCSTPAHELGGPHRDALSLQALRFHRPQAQARAAGAELRLRQWLLLGSALLCWGGTLWVP